MGTTHKVLIKLVFIFSVSSQNIVLGGPPGPSSRLSPSSPLVSRRGTSSQERAGQGAGLGAPCKILFSGSNTAGLDAQSLVFRGRGLSEHFCGGTTIVLIRDVSEQIISITLSIKRFFPLVFFFCFFFFFAHLTPIHRKKSSKNKQKEKSNKACKKVKLLS